MLEDQLRELFNDASIGLVPRAVQNGADEYSCPCCGEYKRIKGYAIGNEHITDLSRRPGCKLYALYLTVYPKED